MTTEQDFRTELEIYGERIISYREAVVKIKESRERGLKVVLAQGVFDIVHVGHLEYLRRAKSAADLLFVGIENDLSVHLNKGESRPFNNLGDRLEFLAQLQSVDFVFGFDDAPLYGNSESIAMYTQRLQELNPNAVAVTTGDSNTNLKKIQATQAGVGIIYINNVRRNSTTKLLHTIGYE